MIAILDGYLQGKGNVVQVTLLNSVMQHSKDDFLCNFDTTQCR